MKRISIKEMCEDIIEKLGKYYLYNIYNDCVIISKGTPNEEKVVYIKKDNFNRVKIGVSNNSIRRNKELSDASGLTIEDIYESNFCTNWSEVENNMHKIFKERRIKGEWFDISEKDAITELNKQIFKNDVYKYKKEVYKYDFKQLERIYKIINSGSYNGCNFDDEFELNCTKEDLKKEIYNLLTNEEDDNLEYFTRFYFDIFDEENKIQYSNFYIEPYYCDGGFVTFNDESYGDVLWRFKGLMSDSLKY